ncbi:hypothetical protein HZ326_11159 [Fusarium oxysporum f. sp. albedinis]|nr:hypothetical protein HZ326_11159 [Fusarium oxysporum f. sp. albedinis]
MKFRLSGPHVPFSHNRGTEVTVKGFVSTPGSSLIMAPNTDIATRALVVSLKAPCSGKTSPEVAEISGLSIRQVDRIYARAIENGFDPNARSLILKDEYLRDRPRSGRPAKATE